MKKKRVMLFYSGAVFGGIDVLLQNLAPRFYAEYDVILAYANKESISSTIFKGYAAPAIYKIPFKKWNFIFGLVYLANIVRKEKIDLLFTQEIPLSVFARFLKLFFPRLVHVTSICSNFRAFTATNAGWTINVLLIINKVTQSLVDKYVSISVYLADYLRAEGIVPARIEVIYLGTNVPTPLGPRTGPPSWIVAYVGRHSSEKGTDIFLAIAEAYLKERKDSEIEFHLFGAGGFCADRITTMSELYHGSFVVQGFVEDLTKYPIDCIVAPSRDEGFSFVMLEAFFRGIPVIASDRGAFPEFIVNNKIGLICSNDNIPGYLDAIDRLKNDQLFRQQLAAAAKRTALANYTAAIMQDKYIAMFNRLLKVSGEQ